MSVIRSIFKVFAFDIGNPEEIYYTFLLVTPRDPVFLG